MFAGTGGLLFVLGAREYAEGAQAQRRARAEWLRAGRANPELGYPEQNSTRHGAFSQSDSGRADSAKTSPPNDATSVVPLPDFASSGRDIPRGAPVARLVIESIELDQIVLEGVGPVELNGGPGHFPGSVLPGQAGNSILSGHRDRHFRRVGELTVGSKIRTETHAGSVEWSVAERRIIDKDTPALFEESEATLTLTTCWPIRYFGPAPDRLLIVAKRSS